MTKPESIELTQLRILDAARIRFKQFGYNKTTLAEIAKDCAMSTANLYRFFENKLDIESALVAEYLSAKEAALQTSIDASGLTYAEKLLAHVLETIHYGYKLRTAEPRIAEMMDHVVVQRKEILQKHRRARQTMLTRLFESGAAAGEFHLADAYATAQAVRAAITLFDTPQLTQAYPLEELERLAANVCGLILYGMTTPLDSEEPEMQEEALEKVGPENEGEIAGIEANEQNGIMQPTS